ncbi:MAG: FtsX-like permease family protein [Acidimicrobiia bacterium]
MGAVWYRFRAELRTRWRSVFALALLVGGATSVVLVAAAGARRTDTAYSRLSAQTNFWDVLVNPDDGVESGLDSNAVAGLPGVVQAGRVDGLFLAGADRKASIDLMNDIAFASEGSLFYRLGRPKILDGRMPDPARAQQVLVNSRFADHHHVGVGDRMRVAAISDADVARVESGELTVEQALQMVRAGRLGERTTLKIVGIGVTLSDVVLEGQSVPAVGIDPTGGPVYPSIVSGRVPTHDDEIALGARTLRALGIQVGDTVSARLESGGTRNLRVVGRVVLPGVGTYPGSDKTALGEGAVLTGTALDRLGPDFDQNPFLVEFAPGADRTKLFDTARALLTNANVDPEALTVEGVQRPSDIVAYGRVRSTPLVLACVLAVLAAATVAHALVTSVRRRRRDLALLKTLGFTRGQVSSAVAWQATTVGAFALLLGIPLGIVLGRWGWRALADNLGTVSEPVVPLLAVVLAVPVVLLLVNLVAFVPGRIAARLLPATVLRSE